VIDPLFRPPLKHYIKGGYGRGEGVHLSYHSYLPPCHTTLVPEGSPMVINNLLTIECG